MEILTLLKANIRHKKGAFISVFLLMIIISMSLTAILSIRSNSINSVENAYDNAGSGDIVAILKEKNLTDDLLKSVESHEFVEHVEARQAIAIDKSVVKDKTETNTWMAMKLHSGLKLFNDDLDGYESNIPELGDGEIYVPQGILTNMKCGVGDKITLHTIGGEYEFTIKGVVAEPTFGSAVIGFKDVFISNDDFEKMLFEGKSGDMTAELCELHIFKSDECGLSLGKFKRQLNLDTGIIDNSIAALTKDTSINYTTLATKTISYCMMAFIGILSVIVMIVIGHSLSMGIEMDYVDLGILKSQGLTKGRLRLILILQYLMAQIAGAAAGIVFAIPVNKILSNVFQPITGLLAESSLALLQSIAVICLILVISAMFVFFITRKIGKISPVRAISGGKEEVYFDSRIKAPIFKKGLLLSLALRQFTSGKRRYAAAIAVASMLVFFMMTINVLGDTMNSRTALLSMGSILSDVEVYFKEAPDDEMLEDIEKTVEEYSQIDDKYYLNSKYISIDGEEMWCGIYKDIHTLVILKGRVPTYDNEIVITDIVSDELGLDIGDEVVLSYQNMSGTYMISGIYQYMNDAGRNFAMSLKAAEKLGINAVSWGGYSIIDKSKADDIIDVLNSKFSGRIEAIYADENGATDEIYNIAINAMKAVIYFFSVIFALVTVHMVCSKAFIREKADIGIYKAMGFTSRSLRLQFAMRFLIVSVVGSVVGSVLSVLFSGRLLVLLLRSIGITHLDIDFTVLSFILPSALICICFFVFAFLVSRKIKSVAVRELVVE